MDALYLYTIRLALNQSVDPLSYNNNSNIIQQNAEHEEEMISSFIFHIKTWPLRPNDKVPKLQRDNLLSLLYHADEQWLDSIRQLSSKKKGLDTVHRQQMIYLDILLLLHKSIISSSPQQERGRLQEPILFAAQILYNNNNNHLRHLENDTEELKPFADRLILALEYLRKVAHTQAVQSGIISLLDTHLLQTRLDDFLQQWDKFESVLYQCYSRVVFGSAFDNDKIVSSLKMTTNNNSNNNDNNNVLSNTTIKTYQPLPQELFSDLFTRLLPMTLRRALSRNIIHYSMIQELDPVMFIAVPRLTVLSGMVYLCNVSGWRQPNNNNNNYSVWFQSQMDAMQDLKDQVNVLEEKTIMLQRQGKSSNDVYSTFVQNWISLEYALVHGWQQEHDHNLPLSYRHIYISICKIADKLLADENTRSFIVILRYLFGHFADTSLASNNNSSIITSTTQEKQEDSLLSSSSHDNNHIDEQTILDLAI